MEPRPLVFLKSGGAETTVGVPASIIFPRSHRPQPSRRLGTNSGVLPPCMSRALLTRRALTIAGLGTAEAKLSHHWTSNAAPPAVCGLENDVPADRPCSPSPRETPTVAPGR